MTEGAAPSALPIGVAAPSNAPWTDGDVLVTRRQFGAPAVPVFAVTPLAAEDAATAGRLAHAYALRGALAPAWAAVPLAYVQLDGRATLVVADPGGAVLGQQLDQPWDTGRFLRVAIGVAQALGAMHAAGLVHRDIKPANLLVDEAAGRAWLTGFTITTPLTAAAVAPDAGVIAGTYAYMAPEQTGRMQRPVDQRSDLYALGVTLYQLLAGVLPFAASTPSEWIHSHMARLATSPEEERGQPAGVLSRIVLTLLAKAPEERYQSAGALEADLRRCLADWITAGHVAPFALAPHERTRALVMPPQLYGRDADIDALLAAFERARSKGSTELVLVAGYSGSGKSALVAELERRAPTPRLFAAGKFDQHKRGIPYSTLAQVCDALVAHVLAQPARVIAQWRDELRAALGENLRLIANVAPGFAAFMDVAAEPATLAAQQSPADFHLLYRRFLQVAARADCPLVLFLDDVQWADAATLAFLEAAVLGNEVRHLLLVLAYRDNEVGPGHRLHGALDAFAGAGARVQQRDLAPLAAAELECLLVDTLACTLAQAAPLAALLKLKTAGNPFFVILFLNALIDDGLLTFDARAHTWQWDVARIEQRGMTDNVADLMAAKLERLSPSCQRALFHLAFLGHSASRRTLGLALQLSPDDTVIALWEALSIGLVVRCGDNLAFMHDRVQEAAYALTYPASRPALHLDIGRALVAGYSIDERDEHVFELANQLNCGLALVDTDAERSAFARVNLAAGLRARSATAHAAALAYFTAGSALAGDASHTHALTQGLTQGAAQALAHARTDDHDHFALAFELALRRGEAEFLTGDLASAEATLGALASQARSLVDHAAVAWMQITLLTAKGELARAIDICLAYLRRVGIDWPAAPTPDAAWAEYAPIGLLIEAGRIGELLALPALADAERIATLDVLIAVLPPAFFSNQNLVCLVLCRVANLSIANGNADASALGYAYLGMMLGPYFGQYEAGYRFGKLGADLLDTGRFERYRARVTMCFGYHVMPWTRHIGGALPLLRRAFDEACEAGDLTYTGFSSCTLITSELAAGTHLREVQAEAEAKLDFVRKAKFGLIAHIIATQLQLVRALRGLTREVGSFDDADFSEAATEAAFELDPSLNIARCWYWIRKLQARYVAGDHGAALAAAAHAEPLLWTTGGHFEFAEFHFYAALARAKAAATGTPAERAAHCSALDIHAAQLAVWAASGPDTFGCRASLVEAERARLAGQPFEALQLYETAIAQAQRHQFKYVEALANELAAALCMARALPTLAQPYLRQARLAYRAWGAEGKARQLTLRHPGQFDEPAAPAPTATIGARLDDMDLDSVVKTSAAISGQIGLDRLIATLMAIVLEHSGAERAVLILPRENDLWVEGEATSRRDNTDISRPHTPMAQFDVPATMIHQVIRARAAILVDDAAQANPFGADPYFARTASRALFCFPLLKQHKLIGVLYLENTLAPHVFTQARQGVLDLLASQAAVSLENASLEENGALLKEVHHRVKNNLQLISSLLSRQAGVIADPAVARLFDESRNRVRAMALVHENLYRAGNFARVPMGDHVSNLCRQIARAYGLAAAHISLRTDVDEMQLDLNRAVSCGLLINELITNALKHAFPQDRAGVIAVAMRLQPGAMCLLTVRDDGIGVDADADDTAVNANESRAGPSAPAPTGQGADARSLGLQLIRDLTDQLHGSLRVTRDSGTLVSIRFPIDAQGEWPQ